MVLITCLFLQKHESNGQNARTKPTQRIRFLSGTGFQYLNQIVPNISPSIGLSTKYDYRITFFEIQYQRELKKMNKSSLDLVFMPQINTTTFKKEDKNMEQSRGFETGINVGISLRRNSSSNKSSYFATLSSGPHYVSETPSRQTPGFIFSDNLFLGLDYALISQIHTSFQLGFRHISNAGIQNPNGGVNNIIGKLGIYMDL